MEAVGEAIKVSPSGRCFLCSEEWERATGNVDASAVKMTTIRTKLEGDSGMVHMCGQIFGMKLYSFVDLFVYVWFFL